RSPNGAGALAVWAPGGGPIDLPPNVGAPLAAGTLLVMQVHYHPHTDVAATPDTTHAQLRVTSTRPDYLLFTTGIGNFPAPMPGGDGLLPGPDDPASGPVFLIPATVHQHSESMQWTVPAQLNGA